MFLEYLLGKKLLAINIDLSFLNMYYKMYIIVNQQMVSLPSCQLKAIEPKVNTFYVIMCL